MIMKKIYLVSFFYFIVFLSYSQDTIRLIHKNYTSIFSKSKRYPVMVEWWVTNSNVNCPNPLKRKNQFAPDPLIPKETNVLKDYIKSGFDRGHMCPAADNLCLGDKVQTECFYLSNIVPQYHSLNAGDFKTIEIWTREMSAKYDSIHVWAGNIGEIKKIGSVSVPKECWKLIYIKKTGEWFGYLFQNNKSPATGIHSHLVTKEIIEKETGFKFN